MPGALGGSVSSLSPGYDLWGEVLRPGEGPLSHTLQCVVLTGIPILEANTTVTADASSIVNPLWRREGRGGGEQRDIIQCNAWDVLLMAPVDHIPASPLNTASHTIAP